MAESEWAAQASRPGNRAEAEWRHLHELFMHTPAALAVSVGPAHVIKLVNPLYRQVFGERDYLEKPGREVFPEVEAQGFLALIDQVYQTGEPYRGNEARLQWNRDGDGRLYEGFFDFVYQPLKDAEGKVYGVLTFAVEVTNQVLARRRVEELAGELTLERDRLAAEAAVRRDTEARFRATFEQAAVGMAHTAPNGDWLRANQKFADILGYSKEELAKLSFQQVTHPDDLEASIELMRQLVEDEQQVVSTEKRYIHKDGRIIWGQLTTAAVRDAEGNFEYLISVIEDISERKRAEEALRKQELEQLLGEQRRRIGQDLHDGIRQQLVGIGMLSSSLQQKLEARDLPEAGLMAEFTKLVADANMQVRRLIHGLVPISIEADSLLSALERAAANIEQWYVIPCRIHAKEPVCLKDNETADHLFHLTQEAMTNAAKHSKGSQIDVYLRVDDHRLTLQVLDDGGGLPGDVGGRGGMGLKSMEQRAELIGARLSIGGGERGGTTVTCVLEGF